MSSGYFDWETAYGQYHNRFPGYKKQPVIGITGNFGEKGCELAEGYFESVLKAGATPVIIPPFEDRDALANVLEHVDGLLLSGGGDLNPLFTGEEPIPQLHSVNYKRDLAELLLIRLAYDRQIPMLGICRWHWAALSIRTSTANRRTGNCSDTTNNWIEGMRRIPYSLPLTAWFYAACLARHRSQSILSTIRPSRRQVLSCGFVPHHRTVLSKQWSRRNINRYWAYNGIPNVSSCDKTRA